MNMRLTPEDILTFYQKYGKLPDTHLFTSEDLKEFFTLLHLENSQVELSKKSERAIWEKTQTSLKLPIGKVSSWINALKVTFATVVAGTAVFVIASYFNNQSPVTTEIVFQESNTAIDNLLEELDTSYIDDNSEFASNESTSDNISSENSSSKLPSFFEALKNEKKNTRIASESKKGITSSGKYFPEPSSEEAGTEDKEFAYIENPQRSSDSLQTSSPQSSAKTSPETSQNPSPEVSETQQFSPSQNEEIKSSDQKTETPSSQQKIVATPEQNIPQQKSEIPAPTAASPQVSSPPYSSETPTNPSFSEPDNFDDSSIDDLEDDFLYLNNLMF